MMWFRRVPLLVWMLAVAVIILGAGVWFFTASPAILGEKTMSEGDDLKIVPVNKQIEGTVEYKIESRRHTTSGVPVANYNSNPPNSGDHWSSPAKNGIYDKQLPDEQLVHNLEHGYVWISYKPENKSSEASSGSANVSGASDEVIKELKKIAEADNWKVILEPREKNDSMIALASWGRVLKMDKPDYDKIKDFIKTYRNRGPEKTPE